MDHTPPHPPPPQGRQPPRQTATPGRHSSWTDTTPLLTLSRQTPPMGRDTPQMVSTHPTGMRSCWTGWHPLSLPNHYEPYVAIFVSNAIFLFQFRSYRYKPEARSRTRSTWPSWGSWLRCRRGRRARLTRGGWRSGVRTAARRYERWATIRTPSPAGCVAPGLGWWSSRWKPESNVWNKN